MMAKLVLESAFSRVCLQEDPSFQTSIRHAFQIEFVTPVTLNRPERILNQYVSDFDSAPFNHSQPYITYFILNKNPVTLVE